MKKWLVSILIVAAILIPAILLANYFTEPTAFTGYFVKVKQNCIMRAGPSDKMPEIFTLYKDEKAGVIDERGDWLYLQSQKYIGFAKKENFIRLNEKFNIHQSLAPKFYFKDGDEITITAIFIFLRDQQIFGYNKDNKLIVSGYCVTGKTWTPTSIGHWQIYEKCSPVYLRGADYCVPVAFWMPFFRGQGLHDAYWRKELGTWEDHKNYGSHGCVNLPYYLAEFLYAHGQVGTEVVVME